MTLEKLKDASCSDGDCVFKITPEMKKGMRTNGGCSCLKDMRHGIGSRKTYAVMVLSQIASEAEQALLAQKAALKEKDKEIARLRTALAYIKQHVGPECKCYKEPLVNYIEPCVYCVAKDALEERDAHNPR